jgi:hypothetical protein
MLKALIDLLSSSHCFQNYTVESYCRLYLPVLAGVQVREVERLLLA